DRRAVRGAARHAAAQRRDALCARGSGARDLRAPRARPGAAAGRSLFGGDRGGGMKALLGSLLSLLLLTPMGRAEELAAGLSKDDIKISSSFTGTDLVLFGAIESEGGAAISNVQDRDVVVVVRGPATAVIVRRKERLGPIWINRDQRRYSGVPGFYFVASTKPLKDIGDQATLERYHLGLQHLDFSPPPGTVMAPSDYRGAVVRAKSRGELYS